MRSISILLFVALAMPPAVADVAEDSQWLGALKSLYFGDRRITESDEVIELEVPYRAEDAALVPLRIMARLPQTEDYYVKTITLIIDKNPAPLAGTFHFTPRSGQADLAMRVRVNEYTPIRAIAETSDGRLTMSRRFVKASGGCSAPVGTDLDAAMKRIGKMKFRLPADGDLLEPVQTQLKISHPNITGMQMDQLTRMYAQPHFVSKLRVDFNGEAVFWAETDISISENPSFRFYFIPQETGLLEAQVSDSKGMNYTSSYPVGAAR